MAPPANPPANAFYRFKKGHSVTVAAFSLHLISSAKTFANPHLQRPLDAPSTTGRRRVIGLTEFGAADVAIAPLSLSSLHDYHFPRFGCADHRPPIVDEKMP
jgi:hypothetical protein